MSTSEKVLADEISAFERLSRLPKATRWIILLTAVGAVLYQIYASIWAMLPAVSQRSILLAIILPVIFLTHSPVKRTVYTQLFNWVLIFLAVSSMLHFFSLGDEINFRAGMPNIWDIWAGVFALVAIIEAVRRTAGWALVILILLIVLYAFAGGTWLPGILAQRPNDLDSIVNRLFLGNDGVFGAPMGAAATYVFIFTILGALLQHSGAANLFFALAKALTGKISSGPAQVAVISSMFTGTINGSAAANVATTGTFTIPLMKSRGYPPHIAAAVEAISSVGGQVMPPIMGAGAFVMAEMLQISYFEIVWTALIPAIAYYSVASLSVHLLARRFRLASFEEKGDSLSLIGVVKEYWPFVLILALLIWLLFVERILPFRVAGWLSLLTIGLWFLYRRMKLSWKEIINAFVAATLSVRTVVGACAGAGIVLGILNLTGLGVKLSGLMSGLAQGNLLLAIMLTALTCIILGMDMPTVAAYLMTSSLLAPPLEQAGLPLLVVHLFIFFMAQAASLTPPVCITSFAAASIAGARPFKTALTGFTLAIPSIFVVGFTFIHRPELLLGQTAALSSKIWAVFLLAIALFSCVSAIWGYMFRDLQIWHRLLLFVGTALLIVPGNMNYVAFCLIALVFLFQFLSPKQADLIEEKNYPVL